LPAKAALPVGSEAKGKVTVVTKPKPTNNPEAAKWINKSLGFLKEQQWDAAATAATHAIALDPGQPAPYSNRAWALIEKGDFQKALADIDMALIISPRFVQAINNKGLLQECLGHRNLAVDSYRRACRLGFDLSCRNFEKIRGYPPSEETKILLQESVVLFGKGDYEKVIDLSTQIIRLDPSSAAAFSNRCGSMAVLGRLSEAEKDCLEANRLDPGFSMAYNNLGVIQEKRGDLTAAGKFFRKSCRMGNRQACKNADKISSRLNSYSGLGS